MTPEQWRASSTLEPEVREALARRVDGALAGRAAFGALVCFAISLILALSTSYYRDYPATLLTVAIATLIIGVVRILTARRLLSCPAGDSARPRRHFIAAVYAAYIVWGAFCAWTMYAYSPRWTAMFLLLNTAALANGATAFLAPDVRLASRCLVILILPTVVTLALRGDTPNRALAAVIGIYMLFLLGLARSNWLAFWEASIAVEREKLRGSEERKRAERERASLFTAIEQAAEEILIVDVEGRIQYCNPAFERSTGYTRAEAAGQTAAILQPEAAGAASYQTLWSTILHGSVWSGRLAHRRKDGSQYEVDGTISPIHDPAGKLTGFVSATYDVTERLLMESQLRQAQKMEGIGRLAGGVAHDFNNLLTVISGYTGLLEERLTESDLLSDYVQQIKKSAAQAAGLTRQLLTFSSKQITAPRPLDLNLLVADMQKLLQRLVGEDVCVVILAGPSLGHVSADPDQIGQILMNLAANARDAMPHGGTLTILTSNVAASPGLPAPGVLLSVSDTGAGMDENTRQHIFEPFFTTKERGRGTGLGLSTVYGIVQQSEGHIDVRTAPGRGTSFNIYFPRGEAPQAAPLESVAPAAHVRGSETVLVAEDQDDVRRLIVDTLRGCGFDVLEAENGGAALATALAHPGPIHLLLTDIVMPDMTGNVVAERLQPVRPAMKVLYISGYSGEAIAHHGVVKPGVEYLAKPFTPQGLAARVRQVLGPPAEGAHA